MFRWRILYLTLAWCLAKIFLAYAQIDVQLCPQGASNIRDPKWPNISPNFEIFSELTTSTGTSEIIQTLSDQRDVIIQTANGGKFSSIVFTKYS